MLPVHALIVEDEDAFADYLEHRLARTTKIRTVTSRVRSCADMRQALSLKSYDVILLDLTLPDSHGVDTVTSAVKIAPNTPIVVLSGHEDMDVAVVALRAGAQDFVVKRDLSPDDLERPILYALMRAKNEQDSKRLYLAARKSVTGALTPHGCVTPEAITPYLDSVEETMHEVQKHLRSNSPAQAEAVEAILARRRFWFVLKDARGTLHVESHDRRTKTDSLTSERLAADLVDGGNTPVPSSRVEAERQLLELVDFADFDLPDEI